MHGARSFNDKWECCLVVHNAEYALQGDVKRLRKSCKLSDGFHEQLGLLDRCHHRGSILLADAP